MIVYQAIKIERSPLVTIELMTGDNNSGKWVLNIK